MISTAAAIAAPLAPVVILEVAGVTLLAILTFLILLGMRKTVTTWLDALVGLLAHTTVFGVHIFRWLANALDSATAYVAEKIGSAAQYVEKPVADFFTHLAAIIEYAAFTTAYLAEDTWDALYKLRHGVVPGVVRGLTWPVRAAAYGAHTLAGWLVRRIATIERELHRDFRIAERHAAAAYAGAIAALAHAFGLAIPGALDWTGLNVGRWWGDTWRTLRRRLGRIEALLGEGAFAALVLRVLARHLPWYRCANVNRTMRQLCRTPYRFLDDLLTLFADFFVLTNICHVIPWLESAFEAVAAPLIHQLGVVGSAVCSPKSERAPALIVPALHLVPVEPPTLHLP